MTEGIVTADITISRHCHVRFAVDNLVEFEAAAFGTAALTFAVVNDEVLTWENVYWSHRPEIMGGVEGAWVKAEKGLQRIMVGAGVIVRSERNCPEEV